MSPRLTLLDAVGGLLVRTYRIEAGVSDLAPFIIGDRGFRQLYSRRRLVRRAGTACGRGEATTLVRQVKGVLSACVYFPDRMIRLLEAYPPQRGVHEGNVDAFAVFVEEIDHLLLLGERARLGRPVSLFELELHANVSKYLVLSRFLAGRERSLAVERRVWLRHQLFEKDSFSDEDPAVRERYRDAAGWAVRLIDRLPRLLPSARLDRLRQFHAVGSREKLRLIESLAA